jgi:hypothetical protein
MSDVSSYLTGRLGIDAMSPFTRHQLPHDPKTKQSFNRGMLSVGNGPFLI